MVQYIGIHGRFTADGSSAGSRRIASLLEQTSTRPDLGQLDLLQKLGIAAGGHTALLGSEKSLASGNRKPLELSKTFQPPQPLAKR